MRTKSLFTIAAIFILINTGCSIKYGAMTTSSEFIYPNSNVTPLGPTEANITLTGFIFYKQAGKATYEKLFQEAVSRYQGANVIIDMGLDVTLTNIPLLPISFTSVSLSGTAAKVEIGRQELTILQDSLLNKALAELENE